MKIPAILAAAAALGLAPAAFADETPVAPDLGAPVATADGGPGAYSLDEQIEAWRAAGDAAPESAAPISLAPKRDRQPHGMVSVGVGTGGYRSVYGRTDLPIGENGTLSLAIGDERGRFYGRSYGRRSLGIGLDFTNAPSCAAPPQPPLTGPAAIGCEAPRP